MSTLDKHAPVKSKLIRGNHKPYISKTMRKAIMRRSELASKLRKHPTEENKVAFRKQKNFCSRLYKKERKKYYDSLDTKSVTDIENGKCSMLKKTNITVN